MVFIEEMVDCSMSNALYFIQATNINKVDLCFLHSTGLKVLLGSRVLASNME